MASSEKYSKLDCRGVTIIEFLADQQCAGRLADKLYHEKRLISKTVCSKAHAAHASEEEKIRPLFNAVLSKVKVDPQNYDKFISVLEDMPAMQDIVEFIEKPLSEEELLRIQGPRVRLEQDNETRQSSADQREITDNHNQQNKGKSRGWCSWTRCFVLSLCVIATAVTVQYVRVQYWNMPNDVSSKVQPSTRGDTETTWTPPVTSASSVPQPQPTSGTYQGPGTQELPTSGFLGKRPTMKQLQLIKWPSGDKIMPIETIATHWRKLGTTLGIPEQVLKGFSTTHMKEQEDCCREVLQRWLERGSVPKESYPVNWEGLINALEDTGLDVVADDMRQMISRNEDGEPAVKPATTVPTVKHAIPTEQPVQVPARPVKLSAEDFAGFPEPTVLQLNTFLSPEVAAHWEEIGEALQIKQGVLSSIRANNAGHQNQHERCLREVFKKWYNGMTTEFSWREIAEILLSMDEARVVEGLYKKLKEN